MSQKTVSTGYEPRWFQQEIHQKLKRFSVLVLHRRAGKALDVDTPIPLATGGFKRMGDLIAGDLVFDEHGAPCRVLMAHPVMHDRDCYEVVFSDGATIVADGDHLWYTETKADRTHREGRYDPETKSLGVGVQARRKGTVKSTREILDTLKARGENNHSIPYAGALQFPEAELPIPPYVFGAWLGDGHSYHAQFTSMDEEVVSAFEDYAQSIGGFCEPTTVQNAGRATTYSVHCNGRAGNMKSVLDSLSVIRNKHIPEVYFASSREQRTELLMGLMDTDGSIDSRKPQCEITQKNERLARDILRLVRSLGMRATLKEKVVGDTTYYRVNFRARLNPFRIDRKSQRWAQGKETNASRARFIVDVRKVESRPVRCITVDSESKLYLASEHLVPTHNTVLAINALIDAALKSTKSLPRFGYVAPYKEQARKISWDYFKEYCKDIPGVKFNETLLTVDFEHNGARISLYGADNPDSIRGQYFDGCVLDEFADMKPEVWAQVVRPMLMDRLGWALFIGTPKGVNQFYDMYMHALQDDEWFAGLYNVNDTGAIAESEIEAARKTMPETAFRQEMLCDFTASGDDTLISIDLAQKAMDRAEGLKSEAYSFAPKILGVDVARYGGDRSVIVRRQGVYSDITAVYKDMDNMRLADAVAAQIVEWQPDAVFIDGGRGEGVIDRLRQLGHRVIEVNFGAKPGTPRYLNKRAEMWDLMRKWLNEGGVIPPNKQLRADLCVPCYKMNAANKLELEKKEDIKRRGMPSPDLGDALALTFAQPVRGSGGPASRYRAKRKNSVSVEYDPFG